MEQSESLESELLVLACQAGDAGAFRRLVRLWHPRLLAHAWRLTLQREVALDVVQETWVAVIENLHTLETPAAFPAWAFRILQHKISDSLRRARRHPEQSLEGELPAPVNGAADLLANADIVERALAGLPREQRRVISLYYFEEFTVAQIAQIEGVPEGTVKSRLFHGRKRMRDTLRGGSK